MSTTSRASTPGTSSANERISTYSGSAEAAGSDENASDIPDSPDDGYTISLFAEDIRDLSLALNTVNFKPTATLFFTTEGMKASVEDGQSIQGSAFIPSSVFQEFKLAKKFVAFRVNYPAFVNCLNLYRKGRHHPVTSFKMTYTEEGPINLLIQNSGSISDCVLQTYEATGILDFDVSPDTYVNKIIMQSSFLKSSWHDLKAIKDALVLYLSPNEPYLQMKCVCCYCKLTITFPRDAEQIEFFKVSKAQENTYQPSLLRQSMRALNASKKISFRTNEKGILSLQYLVQTLNGHVCFVDFLCSPYVGDDESGISSMSSTSSSI